VGSKASVVFEGKRISVVAGLFELPSGEEVYKEFVKHPGAVVVVAESESGELLLLRQYRIPVGEWVLEFPAGTLESGEPPEKAAARELVEEAGYEAEALEVLGSFYSSPGISNEVLYAFLARGLKAKQRRPERGELISEVLWVSKKELARMVTSGQVRDAKTIAAFALYCLKAEDPRRCF